MNYVQLCSAYAPSWGFGGVVRILYGYASYLSAAHRTVVLTGNLNERQQVVGPEFDEAQPYEIRRYKLASRSLARRNIHVVSPHMAWDLLGLVRKTAGPVLLHVSEIRSAPNLYAMLAKAIFGRRVKIVHSALGALHEKPSRVRALYDCLFMGMFLKAIDLALAENDHEADEYRRLMTLYQVPANDRIVILPLQVDPLDSAQLAWFDGGVKRFQARDEVRGRLGLPQSATIFCFLGRFHPKKGIQRTIDLFCAYKAASGDPSARLLVIGRDEGFEQEIRCHAAHCAYPESIHIITDVYAERFDYYFAADIFIGAPTMFEETMLSSLEALSCGTPLFLSREADAPYVEEDGAGRVIDFEPELALEVLSDMVARYSAFVARTLPTAAKFSSDHVLARLEVVLTAAIEDRPLSTFEATAK